MLLRAVNVGGHSVRMADLRDWLAEWTGAPARTYLQSGNALVTSADPAAALESRLAQALEDRLGHPVGVLARTGPELERLVAANPLARADVDERELHATLLQRPPDPERLTRLEVPEGSTEELALGDRVVYLRCPAGYGQTKLHNAFLERRLGVVATTRNWRTIGALVAAINQSS